VRRFTRVAIAVGFALLGFQAVGGYLGPPPASAQVVDLPPSVVVSAPTEGEVLRGTTFQIRGTAGDDLAVASVELSLLGTDPTPPTVYLDSGLGTPAVTWHATWTLPPTDNGAYTILATARDAAGNLSPQAPVAVQVDNQAPTVTAFLIEDDAAFTAVPDVSITVTLSDGSLPPLQMQLSNEGDTTSTFGWIDLDPGGAQPWTLRASWTLTAGDGLKTVRARFKDRWGNMTATDISDSITLSTSGPVIVSQVPLDGATGVSPFTAVQASFSQPLDPATVNPTTVQVLDGGGTPVSGGVTYESAGNTVVFTPSAPLTADSDYSVRIADVRNGAGRALAEPSLALFRTGGAGTGSAGIVRISPAQGATAVPTVTPISVTFSSPMRLESLQGGGLRLVAHAQAGDQDVPGSVRADGSQPGRYEFVPASPLAGNTRYTVIINGADSGGGVVATDFSGAPLPATVTSDFTTGTPTSPHGVYSTAANMCSLCHGTHQDVAGPSTFGGPLLRRDREVAVCYTCHDGTGASSDISILFRDAQSGHVLEDTVGAKGAGMTSRCSSCHDPHGEPTTRPGIPSQNLPGVSGDNATWCLSCHNDAFDWAGTGYPYPSGGIAPDRPLRDATGFPVRGTFPGATAYNDTTFNAHNPTTSTAVVWPGTNYPSGDCRNCHEPHGSAYRAGLRAEYRSTPATWTPEMVQADRRDGTYAALCFTCHDADGPAGSDIRQFASYESTATTETAGHRISSPGGTLPVGAALPCYDCHGPHGSRGNNGVDANRSLLSDEQWSGVDTSTTAGVVGFCFKCHLPAEYALGSEATLTAGTVPTGQLTTIEGLSRTDPATRLPLTPGPAAHTKANMDTPTVSCYDCHGRDYGPPGATAGFNVHRPLIPAPQAPAPPAPPLTLPPETTTSALPPEPTTTTTAPPDTTTTSTTTTTLEPLAPASVEPSGTVPGTLAPG